MKLPVILLFLTFLATPVPAAAEIEGSPRTVVPHAAPPALLSPVACTLGTDCWVMNYMDIGVENDGKATDPYCGTRSYENNKGTVFALRDIAQMTAGVNVRAALDGTVQKVRSEEPDRVATDDELKTVQEEKKECGNAVLIQHADKLQTVYCHLKKGSITVKVGDEVRAGDAIGQIGLSGYTRFPQLHFGVLWNNAVVDPFTGLKMHSRCGSAAVPLWKVEENIAYHDIEFYNAGFSSSVPTLEAVDQGTAVQTVIPATAPTLSFWTALFGVRDGDVIVLTITAPTGEKFSERTIQQKGNFTRQLYYTGRTMIEGTILPPGNYKGHAVLTRTAKDGTKKEWSTERSVTIGG